MNSFRKQVYKLTQNVPEGKVTTYKAIAQALNTQAYRAVGSALANNPDTTTTPCHRVINSDLRIGGYMGLRDNNKKEALLRAEGVCIHNGRVHPSCVLTQPKECSAQDHYTE